MERTVLQFWVNPPRRFVYIFTYTPVFVWKLPLYKLLLCIVKLNLIFQKMELKLWTVNKCIHGSIMEPLITKVYLSFKSWGMRASFSVRARAQFADSDCYCFQLQTDCYFLQTSDIDIHVRYMSHAVNQWKPFESLFRYDEL